VPYNRSSLDVVEEFRDEQHAISLDVARRVRTLFARTVPSEPDDRGGIANRIETFALAAAGIVAAGQTAAVRSADRFVSAFASSELGERVPVVGIDPRDHVGSHYGDDDDLPLEVALAVSPTRLTFDLLRRRAQGDPFKAGGNAAGKIARNEVIAAGRDAVVVVTAELERRGQVVVRWSGWIRGVAAGACPACTSLARGEVLSWSTPMAEHPACRCVQIPVVRDLPDRHPVPRSRELFDALDPHRQDVLYGADRAERVRGGAPIAFVHEHGGFVVPEPQGVSS
jgi:hypothetical protein